MCFLFGQRVIRFNFDLECGHQLALLRQDWEAGHSALHDELGALSDIVIDGGEVILLAGENPDDQLALQSVHRHIPQVLLLFPVVPADDVLQVDVNNEKCHPQSIGLNLALLEQLQGCSQRANPEFQQLPAGCRYFLEFALLKFGSFVLTLSARLGHGLSKNLLLHVFVDAFLQIFDQISLSLLASGLLDFYALFEVAEVLA